MLLISASCVSGAVAQPPADGGGQAPDRRRDVQLLADDPQPGVGDLPPQPRDAHLLEQVVVLDLAAPRGPDERVLVRRLLQRPRRVTREEPERAERRRAAR